MNFDCDNCSFPYDPTRHRWLCPSCGFKASCCEGAPLPPPTPKKDADAAQK